RKLVQSISGYIGAVARSAQLSPGDIQCSAPMPGDGSKPFSVPVMVKDLSPKTSAARPKRSATTSGYWTKLVIVSFDLSRAEGA
ncbi:MAG: hypothetical protein ACR2PG_13125, partial [Hyphomicrobiaceae bacterium]